MKLQVTDSEGRVHRFDELLKKKAKDAEEEVELEEKEEVKEEVKEDTFSKEEIDKLKKLIPHLDELLMLLDVEKAEHEDFDEEEIGVDEEFVEKNEIEDSEDEMEKEVEFEEKVKNFHDSKRSFGSIETRANSQVDELLEDDEIAKAWANRYNK